MGANQSSVVDKVRGTLVVHRFRSWSGEWVGEVVKCCSCCGCFLQVAGCLGSFSLPAILECLGDLQDWRQGGLSG